MNGNSNSNRTFFVHFFTVNWIKIKIITQTTIFSCHITANSNKYSCDNCQKICDNIPIFWSCVYSEWFIRFHWQTHQIIGWQLESICSCVYSDSLISWDCSISVFLIVLGFFWRTWLYSIMDKKVKKYIYQKKNLILISNAMNCCLSVLKFRCGKDDSTQTSRESNIYILLKQQSS